MEFIVPKVFTFASNYSTIREDVFNNLTTVNDCKKIWKEVKLEQLVFILERNVNNDFYSNGVLFNESIRLISKIPKDTYKFRLILNDISDEDLKIANNILIILHF